MGTDAGQSARTSAATAGAAARTARVPKYYRLKRHLLDMTETHAARHPGAARAHPGRRVRHLAHHRAPGPPGTGRRGPARTHPGQGHLRRQAEGLPGAATDLVHRGHARPGPGADLPAAGHRLHHRRRHGSPGCSTSRPAAGCCASSGCGWPAASRWRSRPPICRPSASPRCAAASSSTPRSTPRWPRCTTYGWPRPRRPSRPRSPPRARPACSARTSGLPMLMLSRHSLDAHGRTGGVGALGLPRRPVQVRGPAEPPHRLTAGLRSPADHRLPIGRHQDWTALAVPRIPEVAGPICGQVVTRGRVAPLDFLRITQVIAEGTEPHTCQKPPETPEPRNRSSHRRVWSPRCAWSPRSWRCCG